MQHEALVPTRVLVLGGSSSLAKTIIARLELGGSKFLTTSRHAGPGRSGGERVLFLDVFDAESVENFQKTLEGSFDLVISFIGAPHRSGENECEYVSAYLTRLISVFGTCMSKLRSDGPALFVNVSSRSAIHPSRDTLYAAVKAGSNAAVRSLARHLPDNQKAVSIVPGLVLGSSMSMDMPPEIVEDHLTRSDRRLLTLETFGYELEKIVLDFGRLVNGDVLGIGWDYK